MNFACPETGLCISPGRYAWFTCSSSKPGFWAAIGAAKGDVFKLPFIAHRLENGCLDASSAEETWINHVGDEPYADVNAFAAFRNDI